MHGSGCMPGCHITPVLQCKGKEGGTCKSKQHRISKQLQKSSRCRDADARHAAGLSLTGNGDSAGQGAKEYVEGWGQ